MNTARYTPWQTHIPWRSWEPSSKVNEINICWASRELTQFTRRDPPEFDIKAPLTGNDLGPPFPFNLMFETRVRTYVHCVNADHLPGMTTWLAARRSVLQVPPRRKLGRPRRAKRSPITASTDSPIDGHLIALE